jgi:hypothetical protein
MYTYYRELMLWIAHLDRTETIVVMMGGMALGTYFLRGLAAKWH